MVRVYRDNKCQFVVTDEINVEDLLFNGCLKYEELSKGDVIKTISWKLEEDEEEEDEEKEEEEEEEGGKVKTHLVQIGNLIKSRKNMCIINYLHQNKLICLYHLCY